MIHNGWWLCVPWIHRSFHWMIIAVWAVAAKALGQGDDQPVISYGFNMF